MTKKELVRRLLKENPTLSGGEIARLAGVSRELVRLVANEVEGSGALRKRARLRAAERVLERKYQESKERLKALPKPVRYLLEWLGIRYFSVRPARAILADGTRVKLVRITRHETPYVTYLRIRPPRTNRGIVIYYDDEGRWYAVPAPQAPKNVIYVKEGEPLPLGSRNEHGQKAVQGN